jgi:hypothetical protein
MGQWQDGGPQHDPRAALAEVTWCFLTNTWSRDVYSTVLHWRYGGSFPRAMVDKWVCTNARGQWVIYKRYRAHIQVNLAASGRLFLEMKGSCSGLPWRCSVAEQAELEVQSERQRCPRQGRWTDAG